MHLTIWQVLFLSFLQGVTELFPISSAGHMVLIPSFLGWGDLVRNNNFLPLVVALHMGTAIALVIYFWRDWVKVVQDLFSSLKKGEVRRGSDEWVSWLVIIGCLPGGLIGVFLEKPLQNIFSTPLIAAIFLMINGTILLGGEVLIKRSARAPGDLSAKAQGASGRPLSSLSWVDALYIGLVQSLMLIPGISRSGVTMVGGMVVRLNHEDAAHYAFLLGTPLIFAAGAIELPKLAGESGATLSLVGIGVVVTGIAAFLSTRFLMNYFEKGRLTPFALYCCAAGLLALLAVVVTGRVG